MPNTSGGFLKTTQRKYLGASMHCFYAYLDIYIMALNLTSQFYIIRLILIILSTLTNNILDEFFAATDFEYEFGNMPIS